MSNGNFTFISAKWIEPLFEKLKTIRDKKKMELAEINDVFGDPFLLANYYVEPLCQHHNPADYNEIESISCVQSPILKTINNFFKGEFLIKDGRNQMFILADAGMGKTSFLLMLKLAHLTSFWPKKYKCVLHKLGSKTEAYVKECPDKSKTILLLDALDEDPESHGKVEQRLVEILSITKNFHRVIITCRTQYFPSTGLDPFDNPGRIEVGGFICPMIFLSLFDDDQVEEYLKKRFSDNNSLKTCKEIISKMESLRFRPLLLAHIEDFINSNTKNWNEYTIYFSLFNAWLLREETKLRERKIILSKEELWDACLTVAIFMQRNEKRQMSVNEIERLIEDNSKFNKFKMIDVGGRSLLNRNSKGDFRFSHYTTQEFLIAHGIVNEKIEIREGPLRSTDQILTFISHAHALYDDINLNVLNLKNADLRCLNLNNANLSKCNLERANLENVNLKDANLKNARLLNTNLRNANIEKADLTGAVIKSSDLEGARLTNAILIEAEISDSNLSSTNLEMAIVERTNLENVNLKGANLKNARLLNTNLRNANIEKADLTGAVIKSSDLEGARLTNAILIGAEISDSNLSSTNLEMAIAKEATFCRTYLQRANLSKVNFEWAFIEQCDFTDSSCKGINLAEAKIQEAIGFDTVLENLMSRKAE